jgi:8-oxo-dGTP pyrophosphatase MutT (NUDIX family)
MNQYLQLQKDYEKHTNLVDRYTTYLNTLNFMKNEGISVDQCSLEIISLLDVTKNLKDQARQKLDLYKATERNFSLTILVSDSKNIWLSQRINPLKDHHLLWQVTGGRMEPGESFIDCAKREAEEEAGVIIDELFYITKVLGFREFPDGKECPYNCAIYFSFIGEQIPKCVEPMNNSEWQPYDVAEFARLTDLTPSLYEKRKEIVEAINAKFRSRARAISTKRKKEIVMEENVEKKKKIDNDSLSDN